MRDADPQAFAYAASTVAARHVGGSPGLSRPEGFHLPASRRTVREPLDSHRSHQVNARICSEYPPMDRAAPHASRPPASGMATPRIDEIRAAKRKLGRLLEDFDASQTAARRARTSSEAQELIDQVVKAGSTVLDY
ncbi:hypothetical protein EHS39_36895 [Ensifer sp. MPMI2T]|nr:hypothetical protein EHS39_36895 [Ensifer sp. MPMI2T]